MPSLHLMFGQAVRRLRMQAGYSQESFADAIGVHRNYIGTVERGETNITLENIARIAKGLKQPIWHILRDMESPSATPVSAPIPVAARRDYRNRPPLSAPRVAERRVEVREQLVGLLAELSQLEAIPKKAKKRSKPRGSKSDN